MAEQRLHSAFAPIDVLTRQELDDTLHKHASDFIRTEFKGVSYLEINSYPDGLTTWTVPGPDSGYAWSLKLVSVTMASGIVSVYLGDNTLTAPVAFNTVATTNPIFPFTSNVVVMTDGRSLTLSSTSAMTAVKIMAKQVPAEMVGKL